MRQWLFTLFFGADEIAKRMFEMLRLRGVAIKRHSENKRLQEELADGTAELSVLKNQYADNKEALEKAYQLQLD
jgi:hypothetical protein